MHLCGRMQLRTWLLYLQSGAGLVRASALRLMNGLHKRRGMPCKRVETRAYGACKQPPCLRLTAWWCHFACFQCCRCLGL